MDGPGPTAGMIGALVTMAGAALILVYAIGNLRFGQLAKEYRPQPFWRPVPGRRQVGQWLRGLEPVPPGERDRVQAVAWARVGRRWSLLVCLGAIVAESGTRVGRTTTGIPLLLVGSYIAFMVTAAIAIEYQARIGVAYLRRHPPAEPSGSTAYPEPSPPGSV